jgi:hypothetical protein
MKFKEGCHVEYKDHVGRIGFTGQSYLTICIPSLLRNVSILVYRSDYKLIHEIPSDLQTTEE